MTKALFKFDDFLKKACYFEASLILVAMLLGWFAHINPFATIHLSKASVLYGVIGTVPLFLMFLALERIERHSVAQIRQFLLRTLGPCLHRYDWVNLFILAAVAGISEEVLFRGVIQPWIEVSWGGMVGLLVSNLLFGFVHSVTPLYSILAALVGIYLGLAMDFQGERNLLTPIIIHTLYDFLAFLALIRTYRSGLVTASKN
ncbi:MAG: CPBP family intramembrane metalloprotease [Methylovulum sp.]|uniref:CPBP family intramembrane glutamic endopeptidase n=1 Tax=Methylovulum sp. TaxID=1916980 RepID=UPI002626E17D|nr:CPBP family intramembrane glutamic endopeptidase [Methylovulum sp.]MDD2723866.1 CPBP family intramembrane metalloprotease [Methylovulum sp.]MDD5125206.1 CPBP family intramembrane metalloprotease [Methylovulum sp.]